MKKRKSYFALLLAVMLLAGISIQAFAAQSDATGSEKECVHQYVRTQDVITYWMKDGIKHYKQTMLSYKCVLCGGTKFDPAVTIEEPHRFHESYTFENYHSGSEHFNKVKKQCACNYSDSYWISYPCPGNGNCILPISVEPVLTEK